MKTKLISVVFFASLFLSFSSVAQASDSYVNIFSKPLKGVWSNYSDTCTGYMTGTGDGSCGEFDIWTIGGCGGGYMGGCGEAGECYEPVSDCNVGHNGREFGILDAYTCSAGDLKTCQDVVVTGPDGKYCNRDWGVVRNVTCDNDCDLGICSNQKCWNGLNAILTGVKPVTDNGCAAITDCGKPCFDDCKYVAGTKNCPTTDCALPPTLGGGTLANGASVTASSVASVPNGSSCPATETRTCNAGVLSGSFLYASCVVNPSLGLGCTTNYQKICTPAVEPDCTGHEGEPLSNPAFCDEKDLNGCPGSVVTQKFPSTICGATCVAKSKVCDSSNSLKIKDWREVKP